MKELWDLFRIFARIGALTFGGGYAMLPMLQRDVVENRGWATEAELMDYYAVGQCTPGAIAVNTAVFVGNKIRGIPGGVAAALGVAAPSLLIILAIALFIRSFSELSLVQYAFAGIRVGVCVLIFNAVRKLVKKALVDSWTIAIAVLVFLSFSIASSVISIASFDLSKS